MTTIRSVDTREGKTYTLGNTVIYICPACGVINPAGPSGGCPHIQLIKFEGVEEQLEALLLEVADARKHFYKKVTRLKQTVMAHVNRGTATVETPHRAKASEIEGLYTRAGEQAFSLTHPETRTHQESSRPNKRPSTRQKRQRSASRHIDDRQLDLLAYSAPKGQA